MTIEKFNVEEMTCDYCVQTIKNLFSDLSGINNIEVDLEKKMVLVDFDKVYIDEKKIKDLIKRAGFDISD